MELRLVTVDNVRDAVTATVGLSMEIRDGVAELLRAELSARGSCSRRALCERVFSMVTPFASISIDLVQSVLAELAARGDVTAGPGGILAAAPLRAVDIGAGRFKVFGSLPSKPLLAVDTSATGKPGIDRVVSFDGTDAGPRAVSSLGGVVLTPERWAGLDRVLPAGEEWLNVLNRRLDQEGELAGARDEEIADEWRAYLPEAETEQRRRWKAGIHPASTLWRARQQRGWQTFAWSAGGSPRDTRSLPLTGDESARTMYSLNLRAAISATIHGRPIGDYVEFECDLFLPRAEYRYLTTFAERLAGNDKRAMYHCPATVWTVLTETLASRLGISAVLSNGERS